MSPLLSDDTSVTRMAAIGFAAVVILELIVLLTPAAPRYEISLFDAYPWYFWGLAIGTLVLGQVIIVRAAFDTTGDISRWWLGILLILAVEALLLLIPYFRGYPVFGRGDVLTHVGFIKSIHQTGMVGPRNIYPNLHLVVLGISYATGLGPTYVINGLSIVVSLFFVVASYVLVTTIYGRRRALFTLPFVTLLIGGTAHINPSPYVQSSLLVPFVLYLFLKERVTRTLTIRAALALTLVAMVLYHPLTTLFMMSVFGIYGLVQRLQSRGVFDGTIRSVPFTMSSMAGQLTLAVFLTWYYNLAPILARVRTIYQRFLLGAPGDSTLESYGSVISRTSPPLIDVLRIALVRYGTSAVLAGIGGLYVLLMAVPKIRSKLEMSVDRLVFSGALAVFTAFSVVFFVADFIVGFGRPLLYARLFGALIAGSLFYVLATHSRWTREARVLLHVTVALLVVLSTVGLYYSPQGGRINHQVTEAELDGSEWFLDHWDDNQPLVQHGINLIRFRDAIYGKRGWSESKLISASTTRGPPSHFNYRTRPMFGETYTEDRYFLLTRAGRIFYPGTYPDYREFWRFTEADFARLERDSTVSQVYDNGDFDAYLITGTNTTETANVERHSPVPRPSVVQSAPLVTAV